MYRTSLLLLLLASALTPRPVGAQASGSRAGSVLQAELPNQRLVRLSVDQGRAVGRLTALTAAQATLTAEAGPRQIDLSAIDTVWLRRQSAGRGALIGGVALGALGAVGGALFCSDEFFSCSEGSGALAGGAVGAVSGALLGAVVGALIPRWKRRFP